MAFEYLMALYLLSRQTDRLAANYGRIENFDYAEAPPLYQEALLLRATQTRRPLDLHGHRDFGGTYFFYHLYRVSGMQE